MSEKIIEIRKPTQKQTITAIKSGDFSEVEKIEDTARQEAAKVFLAVASGSVPLIWYDLPPGSLSVWGGVRHAVRPAPVNEARRIFAAVLHGTEGWADHSDF